MKYTNIVLDLLNSWKKRECINTYDPEKDVSSIRTDFVVQILLYKLIKMKIDVIFPSEALSILAACAEKPQYIQLMAKEVLITAMKHNNGFLPRGYIVKYDDFIGTWPYCLPVLRENGQAMEEYKRKWHEQKYYSNPLTDNRCDTYEWWNEIKFKDSV